MNIFENLQDRGLIFQMTHPDELTKSLGTPLSLYCGFDPTADSLHVGSLVPVIALERFREAGHTPVALIGGATGLIGDPSGKQVERVLKDPEQIQQFTSDLANQLKNLLGEDLPVVNNADWFHKMSTIEFLRDVGKHFSVNAMIQRDSVKQRLQREGEGISLTEFSYMALQAWDFVELNRRHNCVLQIGGSDQWGNIVSGVDLGRRILAKQFFGLTLPLVTKSDGAKFGKSETGNIWLSSSKTSPYQFYQFWLNTADADVYQYLKSFTLLPVNKIEEIQHSDRNLQKPEAQKYLADWVTKRIHGEEGLASARRITEALFINNNLENLTIQDWEQLRLDGLPSTCIPDGTSLLDAVVKAELALSNRQAKELISSGAIRVNQDVTKDLGLTLARPFSFFEKYILLKKGKKVFHLCFFA